MKRGPKQSFPGDNHAPAEGVDAIVQIKVWLLGISPMVWRRVLVPVRLTLRELHGIIQVAMGWESIHLYQFRLRAARYGLEHWQYDTFRVTWRDPLAEPAYVTFAPGPDAKVERISMRAASPIADFSWDYQDLDFRPASK